MNIKHIIQLFATGSMLQGENFSCACNGGCSNIILHLFRDIWPPPPSFSFTLFLHLRWPLPQFVSLHYSLKIIILISHLHHANLHYKDSSMCFYLHIGLQYAQTHTHTETHSCVFKAITSLLLELLEIPPPPYFLHFPYRSQDHPHSHHPPPFLTLSIIHPIPPPPLFHTSEV